MDILNVFYIAIYYIEPIVAYRVTNMVCDIFN